MEDEANKYSNLFVKIYIADEEIISEVSYGMEHSFKFIEDERLEVKTPFFLIFQNLEFGIELY